MDDSYEKEAMKRLGRKIDEECAGVAKTLDEVRNDLMLELGLDKGARALFSSGFDAAVERLTSMDLIKKRYRLCEQIKILEAKLTDIKDLHTEHFRLLRAEILLTAINEGKYKYYENFDDEKSQMVPTFYEMIERYFEEFK